MECDFKAWQKSAGDSISIDYFVTPAMNAVCKSYKAALNKFHVFCQKKIPKIRGSAEKKTQNGKKHKL